jgi:rhodanese-related sulfurtransferase
VGVYVDAPAERQDLTPEEQESLSIEVTVREARQRLNEEAVVLVDVREPYEYAAAHVPDARLIPLGALPGREAELPRDRGILFICESGNRSLTAARGANQRGFRCASGAGGTWIRRLHGLPVERGL